MCSGARPPLLHTLLLLRLCGPLRAEPSTRQEHRAAAPGAIDAIAVGFADGVPAEKLHVFVASFLVHARPLSRLVLFSYRNPPEVARYGPRVRVVQATPVPGVHLSNHRHALQP